MINQIKHFIVDLEDLRDKYSYWSEEDDNIRIIISKLEDLVRSLVAKEERNRTDY